jgi:hydrogenase/urease accessory protein HupE
MPFRTMVIVMSCLLGLAGVSARAHQVGLSTLSIQLHTNTLDADLIISWQDVEGITPLDSNQDRELGNDEFAVAKAKLLTLAETAVSYESDGKPLKLLNTEVQREDTTGIRLISHWEFPVTRVLLVQSEIINDLPRGHRQIVSVRGMTNALLAEYAMMRDRNLIEVPLEEGAERPTTHTVREFLWLGVEHILTGWDHLTFLLGLLVVGGRGREVAKIITSFTVAHSLTLALATLNLIRLPSALVEAIIAASIVYVGVENMIRRNYRGRWALTFVFGLVHGCGFATALRDLGVGAQGEGVSAPLICFNVGVELGQLAIAAAVLPWIWKLKPKFEKWWIPVTSSVIALIGAWFLVQRTFL